MRRIATLIFISLLSLPMPLMAENTTLAEEQAEDEGLTKKIETSTDLLMALIIERLKLTEEKIKEVRIIVIRDVRGSFAVLSPCVEGGQFKPEVSFATKRNIVDQLKAIRKKLAEKLSQKLSSDQIKEYQTLQKEKQFRDILKGPK